MLHIYGNNTSYSALKAEESIGKTLYDIYPYMPEGGFVVMRAMNQRRPILNEYHNFMVNGKRKCTVNSGFPLISGGRLIGGIVFSVELKLEHSVGKKQLLQAQYRFEMCIRDSMGYAGSNSRCIYQGILRDLAIFRTVFVIDYLLVLVC